MAQVILDEGAAPSTPSAGKVTIYAKTDGKVYIKDDAGTESELTGAVLAANTFTGTQDLNNNRIDNVKAASQAAAVASSGTTGAVTINWTSGALASQAELTGAITYTFTAPTDSNVWCTIMGASDGTSTSYATNWPGTVIWYGTAFSATTANKKWLVRMFWDGTNYHAFGASQV